MGDAAGKLAHRLHFLRMVKLAFHLPEFGDVGGNHADGENAAVFPAHRETRNMHVALDAVRINVGAFPGGAAAGLHDVAIDLTNLLRVWGGKDVLQHEADDRRFLAGVADVVFAIGQKVATLQIPNGDCRRCVLHNRLESVFRLPLCHL